jgi:hypothetical protein
VSADLLSGSPATGTATGGHEAGRMRDIAAFVLLSLLLVLVLCFSALHLGNQDTWFHLVLGDRFRHGWSLQHPGALTPFATADWVPTQWSTEVVASQVEAWFGLPGVAWLFGALYLALVLTTYVSCRRLGGRLGSAAATALVVLGCAPVLSARPQIVSLVLLTVTVAAWLRTADDGRPRWWLVPTTWVWATAHGLWSAGVLLGLVCWLGLVLDRRVVGRRALRLLAVPVLSLVATMLTPVGPRLLTSQLAVGARTSMIAEWGPTDFRSVPTLAVALMLALVVVFWARRGRVSWLRLGLLLLAGGWALLVARMVSLGAVVLAPLLAEAIGHALEQTRSPVPAPHVRTTRRRMPRWERVTLLTAAVGYLATLAVAAPHAADRPDDVPAALAPRLAALPSGSTVLVEDGIGGWMEWRVPSVAPVIDGMLDAYPVDYIHRFFAATRVEPGWRTFVSDSGAGVGVLRAGSPLSAALQDQLGWRRVARDSHWVYLAAPRHDPTVGRAGPQ